MQNILHTDPIELTVGKALIPLVDERQKGDLLDRILILRQQAALEIGIRIPPVRIRDDVRLAENEYVVRILGVEITRAWILAHSAAPDIIAAHLMELLTANAADLLSRRDVEEMIATLRKTHAPIVDSIVPKRISLGTLQLVLQHLLRERIPVRDLVTILETVGPIAMTTKDPEVLANKIRRVYATSAPRHYTTAEMPMPHSSMQKPMRRTSSNQSRTVIHTGSSHRSIS